MRSEFINSKDDCKEFFFSGSIIELCPRQRFASIGNCMMLFVFGLAKDRTNRVVTRITHDSKGSDQSGGWMTGVEMSAFLIVWKAFKHSSVNLKGTSLASRFVNGLEICEKSLMKCL